MGWASGEGVVTRAPYQPEHSVPRSPERRDGEGIARGRCLLVAMMVCALAPAVMFSINYVLYREPREVERSCAAGGVGADPRAERGAGDPGGR